MFFLTGLNIYLAIYIGAAVIPAVGLMFYVYRKDMAEPEPPALLLSLIFWGIVAAFIAMIPEIVGERIVGIRFDPESFEYTAVLAFFVIGIAEEGAKFWMLYRRTWRDPNFNYRFDGIVYAVFVSLGFAAFENVRYVFNYGLAVALPRALLAIPGHASFAVVMGLFYGLAKQYANSGYTVRARILNFIGVVLAVIMHGVYDTCALTSSNEAYVALIGFVIFLYVISFLVIRYQSRHDESI
ncbi:MAG: PrsW family intramembrane metalloprotease [Clostridia bacterium]|nr:PrsW family intramembrane metalloprotease [Clostridia bacterium]